MFKQSFAVPTNKRHRIIIKFMLALPYTHTICSHYSWIHEIYVNYYNAYNLCTGTLISKHICVYNLDYEFIFAEKARKVRHCARVPARLANWVSRIPVQSNVRSFSFNPAGYANFALRIHSTATARFIAAWQVGEMMNMKWKCELRPI